MSPQHDRSPDDTIDAFSIPEFCRRHQISESYYHKLKNQGLGPTTMRLGRRILISREAAARWRKQHTYKKSGTSLSDSAA
jgi:hypothetical protein